MDFIPLRQVGTPLRQVGIPLPQAGILLRQVGIRSSQAGIPQRKLVFNAGGFKAWFANCSINWYMIQGLAREWLYYLVYYLVHNSRLGSLMAL